jgi:hypothetical protein
MAERAPSTHHWQVIVGNIGTVYDGDHRPTAMATYAAYRSASRTGRGRGAHEEVTLMRDDEVYRNTPGAQDEDGGRQPLGRIAMRRVGDSWVSYYAAPDTMDGAVELLRAPYGLADGDVEIKRQFEQLSIAIMNKIALRAIGRRVQIMGRDDNPKD